MPKNKNKLSINQTIYPPKKRGVKRDRNEPIKYLDSVKVKKEHRFFNIHDTIYFS